MNSTSKNNSKIDLFLDLVERGGNKLPDPLTIFFSLSVMVLAASSLLSYYDVSALNPADNQLIKVENLLTQNGLRRIFTELVKNFALFPPFAMVLVCMLGIGLAEKVGLIQAALKKTVTVVPSSLLPATLIFTGVMSNVASDAGYIVLTPLGAVLFAAFGRHPIAGLTACFAGVSGGFSANLVLSSLDPLLAGLSTKAAHLVNPNYEVLATANYFFMIASTILITLVGTWVTTKVVEPRLGPWINQVENNETIASLSESEKKGLWWTFFYFIGFIIFVLFLTFPKNAVLKDEQGLGPFYQSIVPLIMFFFLGAGLVYGLGAKSLKSDKQVNKMLSESMAGMGSYIVLAFICAQFVAYFSWSNIGVIIAIKGAGFLQSIGLTGVPLLILFILTTAFLNLFMGSASAKWAIMAPVFIPMFMMLGYSPELVQNCYRIGDSVTNIISPLMPYFPIVLAFARKYQPNMGIGTLISLMLPYSLAFLFSWITLFTIWFLLGIPMGPNSSLFYQM